jgi:hypothetical protein
MRIESPFSDSVVVKVWEWMKQFHEFMVDDYCPKSLEETRAKHEADLRNGSLEYGILSDDGVPLGAVWAEKRDGMYFGHLVFERDILTPSEKFKFTQQAMRLMFASGVKKVIWLSLDSNRPFKLFLRKLRAEKKELVSGGAMCDGQAVPVQVFVSESVNQ